MKSYYIYIAVSKRNGTLYIGVTNNLIRRIYEHKKKIFKGFTSAYNVDKLVYFEETNDVTVAIDREKDLKKWKRKWKMELIEENNPRWNDLYYEFGGLDDYEDLQDYKGSGYPRSRV